MDDLRSLSSKGQVVVPKKVREYLNIEEGDMLRFVIRESGEVVLSPVKNPKPMDLFGSMPPKNKEDTKDLDRIIYESKQERSRSRREDGGS